MKRLLLVLLPLACGCIGEQTRAAFTLRAPSSDVRVAVADHAAEHSANLQRALDEAIRAQEAQDDREWNDMEGANAPARVAALPAESCAVLNLDTDTCDDL